MFTCCTKPYLSNCVISWSKMSDKRAAIIELHRAGKTNSEKINIFLFDTVHCSPGPSIPNLAAPAPVKFSARSVYNIDK